MNNVSDALTPTLSVSPQGRLHFEGASEDLVELAAAFANGSGHGLLLLESIDAALLPDAVFAYWRDFARAQLAQVAAEPGIEDRDFEFDPLVFELDEADVARLLLALPPMKGAEYVGADCLRRLRLNLSWEMHKAIFNHAGNARDYFASRHPHLKLLGRVCFHLAENKHNPDLPFAFLATYAHQVGGDSRVKHLPLNRALEEYAGANKRKALLHLLEPINKAAQASDFIKGLADSGAIYHPQGWTAREAYKFLTAIPVFEHAGIAVRVPDWWKTGKATSPEVKVTIGEKPPFRVGAEALLSFDAALMLGDDAITERDIAELLERSDNLVFFKGKWVEVDQQKLDDLLGKWKAAQAQMREGGVTFAKAMRMMAGMGAENQSEAEPGTAAARVVSGPWLEQTLRQLRDPAEDDTLQKLLDEHVRATLRPYQRQGVAWLNLLHQLQLGAVLADDMGLGKTLQVIALLALNKSRGQTGGALLVVPASLIGNWLAELKRFAPTLVAHVAHPTGDGLEKPSGPNDAVIVTYAMVARLHWVQASDWSLIVLDEAQAIKNPDAKQTKAVKALKATHRLALTGTPVENRLADLWSLFDFASPGLLGSPKQFDRFMKRKDADGKPPYAALRTLTQPYLLRRLKTDKRIISDLPDKTEMKTFCGLSKAQIALYQQTVEKLDHDLREADGIQRRGIILACLMRFKQICNHPSQWLKDESFTARDSGKFQRLAEICEVIAEKQEKALVFTQFREMTGPLHAFLTSIFGTSGLVLHGGTPVGERQNMVQDFQREDGPPFFVLSLKAGGTGLNLTAAAHVIHFDRWWNPAVENQATDRAFRIGQKRNVLVHKFICTGTLEERIDQLIESKRALSDSVIEGGDGAMLTEMSNAELLKIVKLDMKAMDDSS